MLWDIMLNSTSPDPLIIRQLKPETLGSSIFSPIYIDEYELTDKYLNHSSSVVDDLLSRYVLLLFMGYGCMPRLIKSRMVLGYLTVINAHYAKMGIHPPAVAKSKTKTARLLTDTKSLSSNRTIVNLYPSKH
jgi:hypothetical protein